MGKRLTKSRLFLLLAEVIAVAMLAIVAISHFGLGDGVRITVAYSAAYLIPLFLLKKARGTSTAAHIVLLLIAVFMSIVGYDSLVSWSSPKGYSLQWPDLSGDARNYYKWAMTGDFNNVEFSSGAFPGLPLMMIALWKVLGLNVIWPQAMNMMFTLASVVLTGKMTRRVLSGRIPLSSQKLILGGMLIMCLLPFYLVSGVTILKEGATFLAFTMAGYALSSMVACDEERHHLWRDIVIFVTACLLLAFFRTTFLYFMIPGVLVMTLPHWRRDWPMSLGLLICVALLMLLGNHFASYSFAQHAEMIEGGWNMQRAFNPEKAYNHSVLGFYFLYSPWHRLLLLPMTMALQFILPFPIPIILLDDEPVLLCACSRLSYGWYLFGGTAIFYVLFMSWRRQESISVWMWWPIIVYASIAYVMGGAMSRYILPFQPLMVPIVLFVFYRLYQGKYRRPYTVWIITLFVLLMAVLIYYLKFR